ncbi:ferredoxin reductase [Streptomyces sp. B93]|uniref:ferredoxin reductase n=1 Tax=Streptomyces sp. B93 TaxID=2824875 RepID=UPI001B38216C|nr:ferredoxin reductase [Streptomyces sp. B93]MBQ1092631.1 ferredoxin reductase [Streptomyces sp. B93]
MTGWLPARLIERTDQTPTGRTLRLEVAEWPGHLPGQHVDVRLTAPDGYHAVRSYSLAAPADGRLLELGVQSTPGGEVSPYLADALPLGALVEVKGPLGGWFVWRPEERRPALLVGGGCGVVPLMAMIRARRRAGADVPCALVYSARGEEDVWYREELRSGEDGVPVRVVHTRHAPAGVARPAGRVTADDLAGLLPPDGTRCYVCGPTGFVEHVTALLVRGGHPPNRIRAERFG